MMRPVLELAILGLLKERPMHGYDLRKRLRDELGPFSNLSFGSLYPALARLERTGAVETLTLDAARGEVVARHEAAPRIEGIPRVDGAGVTREAARRAGDATGPDGRPEPAPDNDARSAAARAAAARAAAALGGRGTRARKVYVLTERGELYFEELLEATDSGDDPRGFLLRLGFAVHLTPAARLRLLERRRVQLLDRVERAERQLDRRRSTLNRYATSIARHSLDLAHADLAWVEKLLAEERAGGERAGGERAAAPAAHLGSAPGALAGILHAGRLRRRSEPGTTESINQPLGRREPQPARRQESPSPRRREPSRKEPTPR